MQIRNSPIINSKSLTLWALGLLAMSLFFSGCKTSQRQMQSQNRKANFPRATEYVKKLPPRDSLYIFIMAGQSNMAGRGFVEPQDTLPNDRILTIDQSMNWVYAKEPLHFYEPLYAGLDCGMSFAQNILDSLPKGVSIAMIPCAVGGSSITQWLNNDTHRDVKLLDNFKSKVKVAHQNGTIKGILWHQGESDAKEAFIPTYAQKLDSLITLFRDIVGNDLLPIILGELGSYAKPKNKKIKWKAINAAIRASASRSNVSVVATSDLKHKGDKVHFDTQSQRILGERYAKEYLKIARHTSSSKKNE